MIITTPPATPTLGLDAASQSPAGQTTETDLQIVNLTGTTSPNDFRRALPAVGPGHGDCADPGRTRAADFTFDNITLATGSQAFIVVASDVAGNSSQFLQTITTTAAETSAPVITAALADDTGISSTDGITYDPTITGLVNDPSGVQNFEVSIDGGAMANATSFLNGEGFTLTAADLATLNGGTALGRWLAHHRATGDGQPGDSINRVPRVLRSREHAAACHRRECNCSPSDLTGTSSTITKDRSLTVEMSGPDGHDRDAVHEWHAGRAANRHQCRAV